MEQKIKKVMAAVFDVPVESIPDDASPHDINGWDSLKHINLIMALEEEFGIHFQDEEIPSLVNLKVITAVIKSYVE